MINDQQSDLINSNNTTTTSSNNSNRNSINEKLINVCKKLTQQFEYILNKK